ncbi:head GIN domain-containing protein [Sandarakinorhabdus sp.]|uniref:head GIN domain-containing protein n=1 Tax=Sandarakinorhabdus sp. TaxID=1916663 RepID=UPI003341EEC8
MTRFAAYILASLAAGAALSPVLAADRRFDATGFDRVAVSGGDDVTIRQGSSFSVVATGADSDLDRLVVRVEKGVLNIGRKPSMLSWGKDVAVTVTMPALRGLSLSGSADIKADKAAADVFDVRLSGSGNVAVASVNAKTANISISGSGDVRLAGQCGAQNVKVAGSGDVDLSGLACINTAISVAGSGNVMARASGQADVRIAGSGDVTVTGGAKCLTKVAGSGTVTCS